MKKRWELPWTKNTRILSEITWQLAHLSTQIATLTERITTMSLDLTALETAVAANTAVDQSASLLLTGLTAKIQELIDAAGTADPALVAKLQALADTLTADNAALAAAVTANTPAQP